MTEQTVYVVTASLLHGNGQRHVLGVFEDFQAAAELLCQALFEAYPRQYVNFVFNNFKSAGVFQVVYEEKVLGYVVGLTIGSKRNLAEYVHLADDARFFGKITNRKRTDDPH